MTAEKSGGRRLNPGKIRRNVFIAVMLGLPILHFCIFYIWLNFNSFVMAFNEGPEIIWDNGMISYGGDTFGWNNFRRIFANESNILSVALVNTLLFFAVTVAMVPVALLISYFLYKRITGFAFFRFVFFLPSIVTALIFVSAFSTFFERLGPVYKLCELFGWKWSVLLEDSMKGVFTILGYSLWVGLGVNMLLYQSAMSRVPEEVMQVGKLDGVGWCRELFQLIVPMIWPTLSMTLLLAFTGMFTGGNIVLLFNNEGRLANLNTISYWIYARSGEGAADVDRNAAAAAGLVFTVIGFPILLFVRWLLNKLDPDVSY